LLDELVVESVERVLLWNGWNDDTRVVVTESIIKPQKVRVAPENGKCRFEKVGRSGLAKHQLRYR